MYSLKNKKASLTLRLVCGVFFAAFSFVYLYCIQGDLLAHAQYVYSVGVTRYSLLVGALVITFVLLVVQWLMARLLHFGRNYYALSYLVPALLLSVLVSVNDEALKDFSFGAWLWIFPLALVCYVVLVKFLSKFDAGTHVQVGETVATPLWINAAVLLALFLMVGSIGTSNDVLHYELKVERLISEKRYGEALEVGKKSLASSSRLTQLRMYALALCGELCERMFDYPQYNGTVGLLDVADTSAVYYRIDADDVCTYLGVRCGKGVCSTRCYLKHADRHLVQCADTLHKMYPHAARLDDYILAYHLLDKNLSDFQMRLKGRTENALPRACMEAMLTCREFAAVDSSFVVDAELLSAVDSLTQARYVEYNGMKNELTDPVERKNRLRRKFGNTYWWYHEYAE